MRFAEKTSKTQPPTPNPLALNEAQIAVVLEQHCYLLDDGRVARQALSCVLTPEVGDRVLTAVCHADTPYVVHILQRADPALVQMNVPGAKKLMFKQEQLSLCASDSIALHAMHDIELNAATGVMQLNAHNLFMSINESLIQNARNYIGNTDQYLLEVKHLLKLHAQQALITAEKDIKVDGERISMG